MVGQIMQKKEEERRIVEEQAAKDRYWKIPICYDEVFAPVARLEAIRIFLAYASYMGFIVYQMDVKSAFLYGKIDEEVSFKEGNTGANVKFKIRV
ncbi:retrovirus-related pol polyprotein from transposon TNT 1-94 [Tanacetum coccineum]